MLSLEQVKDKAVATVNEFYSRSVVLKGTPESNYKPVGFSFKFDPLESLAYFKKCLKITLESVDGYYCDSSVILTKNGELYQIETRWVEDKIEIWAEAQVLDSELKEYWDGPDKD